MSDDGRPWLIVVTGSTGTGKSTLAEGIAGRLGATVISFDWLMSALRAEPAVWAAVEFPVEQQRRVGWNLLSRVATQQLRRNRSCVLDLVAREEPRREWERLAHDHDSSLAVIECVCSDAAIQRDRVTGRDRGIPDWYELDADDVMRSRERYQPLADPKLVVDAVDPAEHNLAAALDWLASRSGPGE